jgi:protein-tyrosine-phosphatase/predicted ATP-grasp superfamily ATP-dependent carboligase
MERHSKCRPVMILGTTPRISVTIARSLHHQGIAVEVAGFMDDDHPVDSRAIRAFHRLPPKDRYPAQFLDSLLALIRERGFDMVIPVNDAALSALAEHYGKLAPLVHVGCPEPRIVVRVLNKALTLDAAQQCGIGVPATCTINSVTDVERAVARLRFPLVAKAEQRGGKIFRVRYFHSLQQLWDALRMNELWPIVLQEYCPGVGIGVEMLMHNGECVAAFQHRRLKEAPASGGVAVLAIAEALDSGLYGSSLKLLRALEWEGPAMVEFRADPVTGNRVLMEVNGRYWGTSSLPILAGVDFPFYHWEVVHGELPRVPELYAVGMRWRWTPGYIDRLYGIMAGPTSRVGGSRSRVREILLVFRDFLPTIREALWSWTDPIPFFAELARTIRTYVSFALKSLPRKLVPRRMKIYASIYFRLRPQARSLYAKLRAVDALAVNRGRNRESLPCNVRSVLFVCYGNIMRSPMAEAMLKRVLAEEGVRDVSVTSAGLHAQPGRMVHPWALTVSHELAVPLDNHHARTLTREMVAASDAIFAMDFENLAELLALYPEAKHKIYLISVCAGGSARNREIPDPYYEDVEATRRCYAILMECIRNLARSMAPAGEAERAAGSLAHS